MEGVEPKVAAAGSEKEAVVEGVLVEEAPKVNGVVVVLLLGARGCAKAAECRERGGSRGGERGSGRWLTTACRHREWS